MRYCYAIPHYKRHRLRIAVSTILLITILGTPNNMARSDSFFIRASVTGNGTTYNQTSVDLGAFVDALGKSILRIHNIQARIISLNNLAMPQANANTYNAGFQLTTQTQSGLVSFTNRALIAAGTLCVGTSATSITSLSETNDLMPQDFTNGYLVAVDQIFLGVDQSAVADTGEVRAEIILECSVETLSQSAAMALALSQQ